MNTYFSRVYVPLQIVTIISIVSMFLGYVSVNWWLVLLSWFLIGPIGMGVGFHRLFAHRSFVTYPIVEKILAILGTLACYSPLIFFVAQHQYHHKTSDSDLDPSSPKLGFWESYLWWRMRESVLKAVLTRQECTRIAMRDRFLIKISRKFAIINYSFAILLLILGGPFLLVSLYIIPVFIEHIRINIISSLSHMKLPLNYRPYKTKDDSQNNILIGIFSCGFGWHNTHHARPKLMICQERWFEIDIEGYICWILMKR